jgi:hypothetical protein
MWGQFPLQLDSHDITLRNKKKLKMSQRALVFLSNLAILGHQNKFFFFLLLFICAYKAWVISPPCPHPLPYHPLRSLPLPPTPSIPSRNYFALISNFVVERV